MDNLDIYTKEKIISTLIEEYIKHGKELNRKEVNRIENIPSLLTIKAILEVKTTKEMWQLIRDKIKEEKYKSDNNLRCLAKKKIENSDIQDKPKQNKLVCSCGNLLECFKFVTYKTKCPINSKGEICIDSLSDKEVLEKRYVLKCNKCNNVYKAMITNDNKVYPGELIE